MRMAKSGKCAEKMNLGGSNTVWKPGKKKGDPWVSEQVPNGKIRPVEYVHTYHGASRNRSTTKPE